MNPERVLVVAAAIKAAPAKKFNIRDYFTNIKTGENATGTYIECKTAACVAGWTNLVRGAKGYWTGAYDEAQWLGLSAEQSQLLFNPEGFLEDFKAFTKARAIAVLKHLAETDEVAWGLFDTRGRRV